MQSCYRMRSLTPKKGQRNPAHILSSDTDQQSREFRLGVWELGIGNRLLGLIHFDQLTQLPMGVQSLSFFHRLPHLSRHPPHSFFLRTATDLTHDGLGTRVSCEHELSSRPACEESKSDIPPTSSQEKAKKKTTYLPSFLPHPQHKPSLITVSHPNYKSKRSKISTHQSPPHLFPFTALNSAYLQPPASCLAQSS